MKSPVLISILTAIVLPILTSAVYADTLIYNNSGWQGGSYLPQNADNNEEFLDYGSSSGGLVSKFEIGYATTESNPGTLYVRFWQGTNRWNRGNLIKTITLTDLDGFSNYKEYTIPEEDRFELAPGNFGYSYEFSWSYNESGPLLASGGSSNENYLWIYYINEWYDQQQVSGGYPGLYMKVYTGPALADITCDITGSKFDDTDGDGVWDAGEPGLSGWEIYIDENGDGNYQASEPNVVTDPNGMYFFENLDAPATYTIREVDKNGWTQTLPGGPGYEYTITAEPNNVYGPYDFGNTDQVISEIAISGYINEGVVPLEGVNVEAYQNGDTPTGRTATTNSQGYYEIQLPTPWTGNLLVQKKGYLFDDTISYSNRTTDITENINGTFLYGGGDGTSLSPFEIWTAAQMNNIGLNPFDWDQHFILMADIDLGAYTGTSYEMIGGGEDGHFSGVFDGNHHVISNFTYTTSVQAETIAIFRSVEGNSAAIKDLTLENPQIDADQSWDVAPLVGFLNAGTVSNCHVIGGQVSGMWFVGGLVDFNGYSSQSNHGIIENCSSSCNVTGFAGNQTYAGGLVGYNGGLIRNCFATGNVSGNTHLGGLVGGLHRSYSYSECGAVFNSYATGQVSGSQKVGGLIGYNSGAVVTDCYATGLVSGTTETGGLCGKNRTDGLWLGQFQDCFWDREMSNQLTSDGGTGLDTADMQDELTFLATGWDFEDETDNGTDDLWKICPGGTDYPRLSWETIQCLGSQAILYPIADVYVKSTEPDTNFGSETSLVAGKSSSTGALYRSFLKFDMSQIPDGYRIISAQLDLQANMVPFVDLEVGAWTTTENWDQSQMTWNDQVSPYDQLPIDTCIASIDYNRWNLTVKADDRYCYGRELSIMLKSTDENDPHSAGFWSSDLPTQTGSPRLIVQYAPIFGGGKGTPDDPYQIWTAEQMNTIGLYDNRWNRSYKLMDDISMAAYTGSAYNQIGRWSTSVPERAGFKGVFDGDGHAISDFQANALFDFVSWGRIQELALIAPVVSDGGALVDRLEYSQIAECRVEGGSVNGGANVGGLIGHVTLSSIGGCSAAAAVNGTDDVGGLIGQILPLSQVENCSATGTVSGQTNVGGLIGTAESTAITHCYASGQVDGTTDVGGFCGYADYTYQDPNIVIGCFWDTTSSQQPGSALGIGMDTAAMQTRSTFTDAGWDFVGETQNGRIDDWSMPPGGGYPVLWYQLPTAPPLPTFAGGSGTQAAPYQIATVDQLNSIGRNTRLLDKHFRLVNDLNLSGQPFTMIANGAYAFMGSFDGNSHTIRNISISTPVCYSNMGFFGGVYTGHVHDIILQNMSLQVEYAQNVGSVVGLNRSGRVENCHSQNVDVYGQWPVGGLVGINYWHASVSNCSVIGSVAESNILNMLSSGVGGLVGENSWWSTIEKSGANISISGGDMLGGLVGNNAIYAEITDCYAIGTIATTDDYAGGLVGRTIGGNTFTNCYAACEITAPPEVQRTGAMAGYESSGTYTDCFWDDQINSGLPGFGYTRDSTVLIDTVGETTANMQTASTYQSQGWDFDNVWDMRCEGMNYPRLKSDPMLPGDFVCPEGVEINDLVVLMDEWLAEVLSLTADMAPDGGDGIVNLYDWQRLAGAWYTNPNNPDYDAACDLDPIEAVINEGDLAVFADQWLYKSARYADIAPEGAPDGRVDLLDYALFAENWLTGLD